MSFKKLAHVSNLFFSIFLSINDRYCFIWSCKHRKNDIFSRNFHVSIITRTWDMACFPWEIPKNDQNFVIWRDRELKIAYLEPSEMGPIPSKIARFTRNYFNFGIENGYFWNSTNLFCWENFLTFVIYSPKHVLQETVLIFSALC